MSGIDYIVYGILFLVSDLGFDSRSGFDNNIVYMDCLTPLLTNKPENDGSMLSFGTTKTNTYSQGMVIVNSMFGGTNYPL